MLTPDDWRDACDEIAGELLASAGVDSPPVDALWVARRLRFDLAWDASQTGRARLQRLDGQPAIYLRPGDRPERTQWAVAHELGETVSWRVAGRLGVDSGELLPRQREELASQLANRLLLPTPWFIAAHRECEGDLPGLKERFETASHELIAWRLLDLDGDRVVTIVDHGRVSRRRANFVGHSPPVHPAELSAWDVARSAGQPVQRRFAAGVVRVWPIHEPGWPREIAVTELDAEALAVGRAEDRD
jgi:hypothetical protein